MLAWYKRWSNRLKNNIKLNERILESIKEIKDYNRLDADSIFRFPMLGEEVKLYLPYAGFDLIQREILSSADFYEGEVLRYIRKTYFNGSRCKVLDIGGNIGNHAVFFAKFCNAEVITFEPQPAIYKILKKNIELNSLDVTAHNFALGEMTGRAIIKDYESTNTGGTQISESASGDIQICSLDDLNFENVYFVKIDVEWFESNVLKGGRNTFLKLKPIIWIEIWPDSYSEVGAILNDLGYIRKEQLDERNYIFVSQK